LNINLLSIGNYAAYLVRITGNNFEHMIEYVFWIIVFKSKYIKKNIIRNIT